MGGGSQRGFGGGGPGGLVGGGGSKWGDLGWLEWGGGGLHAPKKALVNHRLPLPALALPLTIPSP